MPRRFIEYSRTEPARTILFVVALLTGVMQVTALFVTGPVWVNVPNTALVAAVCSWAIVSCYKNNLKHMSLSSFWLFMMWLWSGMSRLLVSPDPFLLLWVPFIVVASAMSVVYVYLSHQRKGIR